MKKICISLSLAFLIAIVMIGCSKTGDTGPAGPVGPAGPDSVYSSQWIILQFDGSVDAGSGDSIYDKTITAPSLTKAILDSGIILTYVNAGAAGDYFVKDVSSLPQFFYDDFSVGSIYITSFNVNLSGTPFRYVTIPGKLVTGNGANRKVKGYTPTELKAMTYDKAIQVLTDKN